MDKGCWRAVMDSNLIGCLRVGIVLLAATMRLADNEADRFNTAELIMVVLVLLEKYNETIRRWLYDQSYSHAVLVLATCNQRLCFVSSSAVHRLLCDLWMKNLSQKIFESPEAKGVTSNYRACGVPPL